MLSLFLDALTRGGPSGLPRPIELHAHDPIRYVGDMLAWVHQAIAAECEFLESLFGLSGRERMVGSVRSFGGSEEEEWVRELLNSTVGKLCVPLKVSLLVAHRWDGAECLCLYRSACYRLFVLRRIVLPLTRWPIYSSITCLRCSGQSGTNLFSRKHYKSKQFVLEMRLLELLCRITEASYKVFFDTIEAQGRALLRIPLVSPSIHIYRSEGKSVVFRTLMTCLLGHPTS